MMAGAAALAAMSAFALAPSGKIVALKENGHTVFVNEDSPAETTAAAADFASGAAAHLVSWSNTEHRWKPVPRPTRRAMRSARYADAEVQALVNRTPMTPLPTSARAGSPFAEFSAPDTRGLTAGHKITQTQVDAAIDAAAAKHHVDA